MNASAPPRVARAPKPSAAPAAVEAPPLHAIRVGELWQFFRRQPLSFWLLSLYVFFEYVRPQQIYSAIDGWPFASWVILLCLAAFAFEGLKFRRWNTADTVLAVFTGAVLLSSVLAYYPDVSFEALEVYVTWVLVYVLISNIVTTRDRFLVFLLLYLLYSTKMSQHGVRSWAEAGFGFRSWGTTCAPGWFHNSGECGVQMSVFFPLSLYFVLGLKPYLSRLKLAAFAFMPVSAIITIIASSSRGAVLALAGIVVWLVLRSRYKVRASIAMAVTAAAVVFLLPPEQKQRFSTMGEDETSVARITYWKHGYQILQDHPVAGIGYANWLPWYPVAYGGRRQLPHSIFIEAGAELGYPGLIALLMVIGGTFAVNRRTRRMADRLGEDGRLLKNVAWGLDGAVIGFAIAGSFVTVLYYPFLWINLAMTSALHAAAQTESRRARRRVGARGRHPAPRGLAPRRLGALPRPRSAHAS